MSIKYLAIVPALFALMPLGPLVAEQTRQTTVIQDMATGASASGAGGTNGLTLDDTQGRAAARSGISDGTSNTLMVGERTPAPPGGPVPVPYPNLAGDADQQQGAGKGNYAGTHVLYQDVVVPTAGSGGGGGKSLGTLQSVGSINQLASPNGGNEEANRHVRHRMFAIVDRTSASPDAGGQGGGCESACQNNLNPGGGNSESTSQITVQLRRLANPSLGTNDGSQGAANLQRFANPQSGPAEGKRFLIFVPTPHDTQPTGSGAGPHVKVFDGRTGQFSSNAGATNLKTK